MQKQTGQLREKQLDLQEQVEEERTSRAKQLNEGKRQERMVLHKVFYLASAHRQCSLQERHQSKINGQKSILMFPGSKMLL